MVNDDICVISYVWETLPIVHNDLKKQHLTLGGLRARAEWKWLINHWADWRCWSQDLKIIKVVRFAHKLRTAGRLLEFVSIPGAKHGSGMMPQFRYNWKIYHLWSFHASALSAIWKLSREAWRVAIQEYLVKNWGRCWEEIKDRTALQNPRLTM